jgi:hypothetical protein
MSLSTRITTLLVGTALGSLLTWSAALIGARP